MIVACELRCRAHQHAPVNAGLLSTICLAFPEHRVVFFAHQDHLDAVMGKLGTGDAPNLTARAIDTLGPAASHGETFRSELALLRDIRRGLPAEPAIVLLLAAHASAIYATRLAFLSAARQRTLLQFVVHGNLNELVGWRSRRPWRRLQDLGSAVRYCGGARARFLVLEHAVRDELERLRPALSRWFDALPHPIDPGAVEDAPREALGQPIRVGFLGGARKEKGFEAFLDLAADMTPALDGQVEFLAVGRLSYDVPRARLAVLAEPIDADPLPGERYASALGSLDYVCLPHSGEHYRLSPSGVLLDAVSWQKPIIALRVPVVERLFAEFGDIGYLCDGWSEMRNAIATVARCRDEARYRAQVHALGGARRSRQPAALASSYRRLVEGWQSSTRGG